MHLFVAGSDLRAWVFLARVSTGARRPVRVLETRSSGSREPGGVRSQTGCTPRMVYRATGTIPQSTPRYARATPP